MSAVIDASALLCVLLDEPGSERVLPVIRGGLICAVNLSESYARGRERNVAIASIRRAVSRFEMTIVAFDARWALDAAELREPTRSLGASLGDRACLALGLGLALPVYTADRRLGDVDPALGIDIRLIR